MLISIGLYVFNVVCAARLANMQNCPRQLAMQSRVLCSFVRCGSSNQIEKEKKEKKTNYKVTQYRKKVFIKKTHQQRRSLK